MTCTLRLLLGLVFLTTASAAPAVDTAVQRADSEAAQDASREEKPAHSPAVLESVLKAQADRVAVIARAKTSVVAIFASDGEGGGSGVLISADGYALTNFHVARPCGKAMKCGLPDGRIYDAVIVGMDPVGDLALIKLFGRDDFPAAPLGDSDAVAVGDWAYVMGNPFLLAADFQPTVTYGVISGVHRYQFPSGTLLEYADCIQTDASINPGNSGGPLFDAVGRLIGVVGRASFEKRGRVNVGAGYAISINQAKNFLGHLKGGRVVDHATLGATAAFDQQGRVVVSEILESSDAYRRGLRYDDEIVALGGRPIQTPNGLKNVLGIYPKGWRIPLSFRRDGERHDVLVRLSGVHAEGELPEKLARSSDHPMPMPKREEGPKQEGPDGKQGEEPPEPPSPIPPLKMPQAPEPPMPEIVRKHYEDRPGYVNYYFNRLNRQRVLDAWRLASGLEAGAAGWTISGKTASGGPFRIELHPGGALLELTGARFEWAASDNFAGSLPPEGSGGMLPALYLWRQLAAAEPDELDRLDYQGTIPLDGAGAAADVLAGLRGGVQSFFFFDSAGRLIALEMWSDPAADPCEIRFRDYRGDREPVPGQIEVRHGDEIFATLSIEQFAVK